MTDGKSYKATYDEWAAVLGLEGHAMPGVKLHDSASIHDAALAPLYPTNTEKKEFGGVSKMLPKYFHMHKILRPVFIAKGGDKGRMWDYTGDLMLNMASPEQFHIFDFIFHEVKRASVAKRSLPFSPFIQPLIETFARYLGEVHLECKHSSYNIRVGEVDKLRLAKEKELVVASSYHIAPLPPKKVSKWQKFVSQGLLVCFTSSRNNELEIA